MEVPANLGANPTTWRDVRLVLQDVILARTDTPGVSVSDAQSGFYTRQTVLGGVPLHRNWQSVDVRVGARALRVFNTHLEAFNANEAIRTAQAQQLVAAPIRSSPLPVVVVCDCNSSPGSSATGGAYAALTSSIGGALKDVWTALRPSESGFSCCQPPDLRLSSPLSMRIDLVLTSSQVRAETVDLRGELSADRLGGLWPSDHAGIVATLRAH